MADKKNITPKKLLHVIKDFFGFGEQQINQNTNFGMVVNEPYTGAWQHNVYVKKDDVTTNYAYFSCLTTISNDLGNMDLELRYQKNDGPWVVNKNKKYNYLRKLIEYPNNTQNSQDFISCWSHSLNQYGNTYCFVDWEGEIPVGLYILNPNFVTILRSRDGEIYYKVRPDNTIGLTQEAIFTQREIIHHRINCLFDPMCGIPPLWASAIHAYSSIEQGKTSFEFYKNAARPSALLIAPQDISQEDVTALKENYNQVMSGRSNAGRMLVISGGVQYQQLTMSPQDQQLIELLKFNTEAICACFHVPSYMIIGAAPTYNNIEALKQVYFQSALQFIITGIEKNLHRGLCLNDLDDELWIQFNTASLLRMDKATRFKVNGQAIKDGWLTINEVREEEDLEPIYGGDTAYLQQQNYSLAALADRDKLNPLSNQLSTQTTQQNDNISQDQQNVNDNIDNQDNVDNNGDYIAQKFFEMLNQKIEKI